MRCAELEMAKIDDWDIVTKAYPNADPGQPTVGKKIVNFTQHCELTLALKMFELHTKAKLSKAVIEIGMSKGCCEWCYRYLDWLESTHKNCRILVRASHGKHSDGWMIPPNGPAEVGKGIRVDIEDKIDDIVWKIQGHRRSDANESPPNFLNEDIDFKAERQALQEDVAEF